MTENIEFRNKEILFFDVYQHMLCYANESQFGLRNKNIQWERDWFDIQSVALSGNWIAIASASEIRIVDLAGNLIQSFTFDRVILAMRAYENLLAIVYHESVPMYESQMLAMKIYNVRQFEVAPVICT